MMTKRIFLRVTNFAAVLVFAASSATALAGDFYEKDGVAIRGYNPVGYFADNKPVKGSPAHKADTGGSVFHFVSQANRDAFAANPAQYAPQYNGFCAFGTAGGYKAAIDPAAFTIVQHKLYLNYNQDVRKKWSTDILVLSPRPTRTGRKLQSRQKSSNRAAPRPGVDGISRQQPEQWFPPNRLTWIF